MDRNIRIVFIGTPDFAATSLLALIRNKYNVVGVITAPDKPSGRGKKISESAVKIVAIENNLKVLQPRNLKEEAFLSKLKALNADLQIVVAFRMLPEKVWNMPPLGTVNLHGSLLPHYRGAAPINWAIINGEKTTGVSTFFLQHEIDTGNIIQSKSLEIEDSDNAGTLHDKLMNLGAELIVETVQSIIDENYTETEQKSIDKSKLKFAPKIFKETCQINWNNSPTQIHNFIKGMSPYPGAYTYVYVNGKEEIMKIFKTQLVPNDVETSLGHLSSDCKKFLHVSLGKREKQLSLLQIQLPGKKRLDIKDFLAGIGDKKIKIKL